MRRPTSALALLVAIAGAATACGGPTRPPAPAPVEPVVAEGLRATIQWTSYGVPHVTADDLAGLGFGQGYATARHHVCVIADQILRATSQRARWFGPGPDDANVDSDFFHLQLGVADRAREVLASMSDDAREVLRGWVAGYNHYLARTAPGDRPAACRDAAWVTPIDEHALVQLHVGLATVASSRLFAAQIANAAPRDQKLIRAPLPPGAPPADLGSNGWAIGGDRTEHDHGLLVANPHFPWEGELAFTEIHLTLPGELDVYGATLPGVPMVGIGFTRHHAWTHTFSASKRFLVYRLRLDAADPRRYVRDDTTVAMIGRDLEIEVADGAGGTQPVQRRLYRSVHGPIVDSSLTPWDPAARTAFALRDVALDAGSVTDLYLGFARAKSIDEFREALARHATPYLNTLYADVDGQALYADGSSVPNLSDAALAAWTLARKAVPEIEQAWRLGAVVVDGSSSLFDLITDDPAAPGAVPRAAAPEVLRRDFVMNANDSWAFTHPDVARDAAGGGFSPLYGAAEGTPSARTLMNLRLLTEKSVTGGSGPDGLFTRAEAARAILSNRSFTGEQLRDEVLERCEDEVTRRAKAEAQAKKTEGKSKSKAKKPGTGTVAGTGTGTSTGLEPLCLRLKGWDLAFDVDSQGAVLWRELMAVLATDGVIPWDREYDPQAPSTPSGLPPAPGGADPLAGAIEAAADALAARGLDLRATNPPLGDVQRAAIGGRPAVPGGTELDGVANKVLWVEWNGTLLPRADKGDAPYPVNYGTSWVMAVELLPTGPVADVLMTYGPGADGAPGDDQLSMFARGALRPALFEPSAIAADPRLEIEEIASP